MKRGRPKSLVSRIMAVELRKEGLSYEAIGQRMGITKPRVWQLLKSVDADGPIGLLAGGPVKVDRAKLVELLDQGKTKKQLMRVFNCSYSCISKHVNEVRPPKSALEKAVEECQGKDFERLHVLTVVNKIKGRNGGPWAWCRCRCGTEKWILTDNIRRGHTKSCTCLRDENSPAWALKHAK